MCDETIQVPETSRGQTVECPACGSYVETSSGGGDESEASIPPGADEDPYQEETEEEEYEESEGVDKRIIVGISAVAAVVVVALIILVAILRSSGSRPVERPEALRGQQQVAATDLRPQPVIPPPGPQVEPDRGSEKPEVAVEEPVEAALLPKPGGVVTNSIGMKLVYIPAGSFMMGSSGSAAQLARVLVQHEVRISEGFWMGETEVTQGQYKSVMNAQPWSGQDYVQEYANNPAVYVSWDDAVEFCRKLSEQTGETYRLPTEAEWEYACRAGTKTWFSFGDSESSLGDYAWFVDNTHKVGQSYAHSVGKKKSNPWGLYDMHGNVCEWCLDWYAPDYYSKSPESNPQGPDEGSFRVLRGGGWGYLPRYCGSAYRIKAAYRDDYFGFRVARSFVSK